MDYVAEDGSFAGFNTAILAEIGRRIDRNMEIIQVDSIGRAAALVSGTVDAVFWASSNPYGADERIEAATVEEFKARLMERHPDYTEEQVEILARMGAASDFQEDIPEHTIFTDPYFVDGIVGVGLKEKIPR
jgi:ABC-type amino acid transport substrate-binding protein